MRRSIVIMLLFCFAANGYSQENLLFKFTNSVAERLNFPEDACPTGGVQTARAYANHLLSIDGLEDFQVLCFSHGLDKMNFASEWETNAEWEDTFYATSQWLSNDMQQFVRSHQFTNAEYALDNVPYVVVVNFSRNARNQPLYIFFPESTSAVSSNNTTASQPHVISDISIGGTGVYLENIRTFWTYERNFLGSDALIVPEVRFEVTNRGSRSLSYLRLKAVFYAKGDNGLLELFDDSEEYVIAPGDTPLESYVQKEQWLTSGVGYSASNRLVLRINAGNAPEMFAVMSYKLSYEDSWNEIGEITIQSKFVR